MGEEWAQVPVQLGHTLAVQSEEEALEDLVLTSHPATDRLHMDPAGHTRVNGLHREGILGGRSPRVLHLVMGPTLRPALALGLCLGLFTHTAATEHENRHQGRDSEGLDKPQGGARQRPRCRQWPTMVSWWVRQSRWTLAPVVRHRHIRPSLQGRFPTVMAMPQVTWRVQRERSQIFKVHLAATALASE